MPFAVCVISGNGLCNFFFCMILLTEQSGERRDLCLQGLSGIGHRSELKSSPQSLRCNRKVKWHWRWYLPRLSLNVSMHCRQTSLQSCTAFLVGRGVLCTREGQWWCRLLLPALRLCNAESLLRRSSGVMNFTAGKVDGNTRTICHFSLVVFPENTRPTDFGLPTSVPPPAIREDSSQGPASFMTGSTFFRGLPSGP